MQQPLSGIKVVDLTRVLAGPWATQSLADLGAEVIKIEHPSRGDDTRAWGKPLANSPTDTAANSAYFQCANRGKRSVCIDIKAAAQLAQLKQLIAGADVVVENYKVGALVKYGLDYASLSAQHPTLIYCSITGFGQTGPRATEAGYDAMIQGMGGLMSITGPADGEPGAGPQKVGVAVADIMTGMYALSGIQAALFHRQRTGEGQYIDVSLFDTQLAWLANQAQNYFVSGESPVRQGTAHPNIVPYQAVATSNGYIMLAVGNDGQFARLCQTIGLPQLADDDRFSTNPQRVAHRDQLLPLLLAALATKTSQQWLELFNEATVPCGPINSVGQAFEEPQTAARETIQTINHPTMGEVATVANPLKFSKTPIQYNLAPPTLGEHSGQYLSDDQQ